MQGKLLRQVLDKMMTSGHAQNARVQVLPNFMHKLKEILLKYSGQDWKTLAFPVLLIYWVIIITATFSL
jgi:hypothetical protein